MRLSHLDRRGTMAGWPVSRSVSGSVSWPVGRSKKVGAIQVIISSGLLLLQTLRAMRQMYAETYFLCIDLIQNNSE